MRKANFIRTKYFAGTANRVVFGVVEVVVVGNVRSDFGGEELGIECQVLRSRIAVEPGPVCEREGLGRRRLGGRSSFGLEGDRSGCRRCARWTGGWRARLGRVNGGGWRVVSPALLQLRLQLLDALLHCIQFLDNFLRDLRICRGRFGAGVCRLRTSDCLLPMNRNRKSGNKQQSERDLLPGLYRKFPRHSIRIHHDKFSSLPEWIKFRQISLHLPMSRSGTLLYQSC